jgi:MFS family permease
VICTYFAGKEQNRAMSFYGAAGAVGFVAGLILGGLLTATLGWVSLRLVTDFKLVLNPFSTVAMDLPRDISLDSRPRRGGVVPIPGRTKASYRCSA